MGSSSSVHAQDTKEKMKESGGLEGRAPRGEQEKTYSQPLPDQEPAPAPVAASLPPPPPQHEAEPENEAEAKVATTSATTPSPLSDEQLRFFHAYGFLVVKGLVDSAILDDALAAADDLVANDERDDKRESQAFAALPEGFRVKWSKLREARMLRLFNGSEKSRLVLEQLLGGEIKDIDDQGHEGPQGGRYVFAARFNNARSDPSAEEAKAAKDRAWNTPAADAAAVAERLSNLSNVYDKEFLSDSRALGINVDPSNVTRWHLDGWDCNSPVSFDLLWGCYLSDAPKRDMGNLVVFPGSHWVLWEHFRERGASWFWDADAAITETNFNRDKHRPKLQSATYPSVGTPYELCVEKGDVLFAHPMLAHDIASNFEQARPRFAVYGRIMMDRHFSARATMHGAFGSESEWGRPVAYDEKWGGSVEDLFALTPGVGHLGASPWHAARLQLHALPKQPAFVAHAALLEEAAKVDLTPYRSNIEGVRACVHPDVVKKEWFEDGKRFFELMAGMDARKAARRAANDLVNHSCRNSNWGLSPDTPEAHRLAFKTDLNDNVFVQNVAASLKEFCSSQKAGNGQGYGKTSTPLVVQPGDLRRVEVGRVMSWFEYRDRAEAEGGRLPTTSELSAAAVDVGYDQWTPITASDADWKGWSNGENAWANIGPRKYQIEYPEWGLDALTYDWKHLPYFYAFIFKAPGSPKETLSSSAVRGMGNPSLRKVEVGRVMSWVEYRDRAEAEGGRLPTTSELRAAAVDVGYDQWTPITAGENAWANIGPRKYQIEYPQWGLDASTYDWKHLTYFYVCDL